PGGATFVPVGPVAQRGTAFEPAVLDIVPTDETADLTAEKAPRSAAAVDAAAVLDEAPPEAAAGGENGEGGRTRKRRRRGGRRRRRRTGEGGEAIAAGAVGADADFSNDESGAGDEYDSGEYDLAEGGSDSAPASVSDDDPALDEPVDDRYATVEHPVVDPAGVAAESFPGAGNTRIEPTEEAAEPADESELPPFVPVTGEAV